MKIYETADKEFFDIIIDCNHLGRCFCSQSVGMEYIGPFTFNAIRCVLGGLVLIPVILV